MPDESLLRAARLVKAAHDYYCSESLTEDELGRLIVLECREVEDVTQLVTGLAALGGQFLDLYLGRSSLSVDEILDLIRDSGPKP